MRNLDRPQKILYWGPYSGHVGTIKAQINSAFAMHKFGKHDVFLIRAHSEFKGMEQDLSDKGLRILDLRLSRFFSSLQNSSLLARRPYMFFVAIVGFMPLIRLIRHEQPDILVLNLLVVPAILAARLSGVKASVIISIQGYPQFLGIDGMSTPVWKRIENGLRKLLWNIIFTKADFVLTMTEQTRQKLFVNTALRSHSLRNVQNPVIDEHVLTIANEAVDHPWYRKKQPVVVGMGRLSYQKGFDILIQAFSKVRDSGIDARLVIVGEGEERTRLESLAEEKCIADFVDLIGYRDNPFPFIKYADLFVLSSRWEDPGHAIIEAAALGTPIVTTDCPSGPSDLVGQGTGGWICRTEDVNDMAEKIRQALSEPDPEMCKIAKKNAKRYTMPSHYQAMENLIKELASS